MLRKLLNLFMNLKGVDIQEVFNKVFSCYSPDFLRRQGNFYMCVLLEQAEKKGVITSRERRAAVKEIHAYVFPYTVLITALLANNLDESVNHRIAIYSDWERRPKLRGNYDV